MIETSMRQLPREVADAYRGLALAPKRLPLDMALLGALLGAPDEETALRWRALLASHSLLHLTEDGMCTAHDLQLDYLKLTNPAKLQTTAARLATLLVAPSTLDRLRIQTSRALGPYCLGLMALWREVERVQGLPTAGPACLGAEALKPLPVPLNPLPVPLKPVPRVGSGQTGGSSAPSRATAEEEEVAEKSAEAAAEAAAAGRVESRAGKSVCGRWSANSPGQERTGAPTNNSNQPPVVGTGGRSGQGRAARQKGKERVE